MFQFGKKKDSAKITDKDPVFQARYIGFTETFVASGKGCTTAPVQKLWDNAGEERYLKRVSVLINTAGILLKYMDRKNDNGTLFPIVNISFCNADSAVNEKIFSWICRGEDSKRLDCHALLCSTKEKSKAMALVLSRAFQIAYKDWKGSLGKNIGKVEQTHSKTTSSEKVLLVDRRDSQCQTDDAESPADFKLSEESKNQLQGISPSKRSLEGGKSVSSSDTSTAILDPEQEDEMQKDAGVMAMMTGDSGQESILNSNS